ncbi:MAG: DpnD/PcfM family protein [Dysosmobacter sp.]
MSEYKVLITETWKRAVTVDAESREEAEAAVRCQYKNGEYALASVDSDGVSFQRSIRSSKSNCPTENCGSCFAKRSEAASM